MDCISYVYLEVSELGEGVDDDAEDDVEADGADEDEEGQVEDDHGAELGERALGERQYTREA